MTQITVPILHTDLTPEEAERSLRMMRGNEEREAKWRTLMLMLDMGVRLDAGRSVQEIMGRQV